jgi:dimethylhistidine N-methyltransferase
MREPESIPCDRVIARLWEYVDGELAEERSEGLQAHLDICARCFPEYDFRRAYRTFLSRVGQQPVPPELRRRVFRAILEEARRSAGCAAETVAAATLCEDAAHGLSAPRKHLLPKYFYDDRGAKLFERITDLEAYYPTRTELGIFERYAGEMAERLGEDCLVVEFGSGSGVKTRILLEHLRAPAAYVPVDISRRQLLAFARSVEADFPELEVLPVAADYTGPFSLPPTVAPARRTVAFFPGSTIGNFLPEDAEAFLRRVAGLCGPGGALLIGVDLEKNPAVIELAYNDPEGVTAAFNLNLLARIDRECGADFDLSAFRHRAVYDADEGRVEISLVSTRPQTVTLPRPDGDLRIDFADGEAITTEYSYKYPPERFQALAERAGWKVEKLWTDEKRWFGEWLLVR